MKKNIDLEGEEQYIIFRCAHGDLAYAQKCLVKASLTDDKFISHCLVIMSVLAYCRPFTDCRMPIGPKRILLKKSDVPRGHRILHEKMMIARNKLIAHADLEMREPKLHAWTHVKPFMFPIQFKTLDLHEWLGKDAPIADLINSLMEIIAIRIKHIEEKFELQLREMFS